MRLLTGSGHAEAPDQPVAGLSQTQFELQSARMVARTKQEIDMKKHTTELDLSDVDPLKWNEVRRRASVVQRYLELDRPTAADRGRFGAMLDLGSLQFTNLVRAWQTQGDARAFAPSRSKAAGDVGPSRRGGMDPKAREIAREVIAELGVATKLTALAETVTARCAAAGVVPPKETTVWKLCTEAKGEIARKEEAGAPETVLVARAVLKLPVDLGPGVGVVYPDVIVVVERPSGRIIEIAMEDPSSMPGIERVAQALLGNQRPVEVDSDLVASLAREMPRGTDFVVRTPGSVRQALANLLGRHVGRIELAYKSPSGDHAKFMRSSKDHPPSMTDAKLALRIAQDRHNEKVAASRAG